MSDEVRYPPDDRWWVKALRFANLLDDEVNKLSPVKVNVWAANLGGLSTTVATIAAWIGAHWGMLDHILSVAPVVGAHLWHAHVTHAADKRERNLQRARMK